MLRTPTRLVQPATAAVALARLVAVVAVAVLGVLGGVARADQKLVSFKAEFVREAAGCQVQVNGLTKVLAGAAELVKTAEAAERAELERAIEQLTRGLTLEQEYCGEVAGMIAFIDANAAAPYRSVQREVGVRYKKIVALRAASKKMREETSPVTHRLIPLMARRPPPAPPEPRKVPGKFPSGRTAELPALPGTWRLSGTSTTDTADYAESPPKGPAISARAAARAFSGATCDQQRKALLVRADAESLVDLDLPGAKDQGVAWSSRYTRRERTSAHLVTVLCAPTKAGGLLATADVSPADHAALADELTKLLLRMLASHRP